MTRHFVDYLPVTEKNKLELYIDGKDYCADLAVSLRRAKRFVFLTGLHFMADFGLIRGTKDDRKHTLAQVLFDTAQRGVTIYLLVNQFWKDEHLLNQGKTAPIRKRIMEAGELHGYLPQTFKLFGALEQAKNVHCFTEIHPNSDVFATNHQKTVVIDDEVAYLGGIDLTYLDGDRWDTPAHTTAHRAIDRTNRYWHDVHLRVEGPAVEFVRDNFVQRWTHGELLFLVTGPGTQRGWGPARKRPALPRFLHTPVSKMQFPDGEESPDDSWVQIVRSMPETKGWHREKPSWNRSKASWERSCKDAYLTGIAAASSYIYLENQWVADEQIWSALAQAARRNRDNPDFRIVVMVPYDGLFAAGLGSNQELFIGTEMERVMQNGHSRAVFGMYALHAKLRQVGVPYEQIYVHSKIMIVDDEWALIGSANAGGISLEGIRTGRTEPDTELSAVVLDRTFASGFRRKIWSEHLDRKVQPTYSVRDADEFRRQAGNPGRTTIRFFPGYDRIRRGKPTWWPYTPRPSTFSLKPFEKLSRIVPAFPPDLSIDGIPPLLMRAAFRAHVIPAAPPGYRVWYRWRCDLLDAPASGGNPPKINTTLRMLGLQDDRDDIWKYSDQASAYIGRKSAELMDRRIRDVKLGRILCRIQILPVDEGPDDSNSRFDSMVLSHELLFWNARMAEHNHPNFVLYRPPKP
ncbi:MAG: phospholipase D-like domain-containing protein [Thermoanaerobaculia bacterium]|nr:phospholipase D-like domain-containing protein [Thermoanaerobaculia bacterium]